MRPKARTGFKIFICRYPISPPPVARSSSRRPAVLNGQPSPIRPGPHSRSIFHHQRPVRAISISTRRSRATGGPGLDAAAGWFDGKLDPVDQRHDPHRHDRLSGPDSPDIATVVVSNLVSATDPMPAGRDPRERGRHVSGDDDGQDGTGQTYEQGFVHLVVTAPSGVTFNSATFGQVLWQLSDQAGLEWDSTNAITRTQPYLRNSESEYQQCRRSLLPAGA